MAAISSGASPTQSSFTYVSAISLRPAQEAMALSVPSMSSRRRYWTTPSHETKIGLLRFSGASASLSAHGIDCEINGEETNVLGNTEARPREACNLEPLGSGMINLDNK